MRILVTGATSYLGGRCVPLLRASGHEVIALTRDGTSIERLDRLAVDSCAWDAAPDADVLIHLATFYSGHTLADQRDGIVRSNVTLPGRLVGRFLDAGGRRVIAAGTCWESCDPDGLPANFYAASKSAFRTIATSLCAERERPLVWLRFSDIIGRDDPRHRLFRVVRESIADGAPLSLTAGDQVFDPVWIDDASAAVVRAVDVALEPGVALVDVGIAGGEPATLREKIQPVFDSQDRAALPAWGAKPYRRGEPFAVRWRAKPAWWSPRTSYAAMIERMFGS